MPNVHTPERLPNESQVDYKLRRLHSRARVRQMQLRGEDGKRDAFRAAGLVYRLSVQIPRLP